MSMKKLERQKVKEQDLIEKAKKKAELDKERQKVKEEKEVSRKLREEELQKKRDEVELLKKEKNQIRKQQREAERQRQREKEAKEALLKGPLFSEISQENVPKTKNKRPHGVRRKIISNELIKHEYPDACITLNENSYAAADDYLIKSEEDISNFLIANKEAAIKNIWSHGNGFNQSDFKKMHD